MSFSTSRTNTSVINTAKALLLVLSLILSSVTFAHDEGAQHLELGVYPHLSKKHLQRAYSAIAKRLSIASQQTVYFDIEGTLDNFHQKLEAQEYDIVMLQPFDYVDLADRKKYEALATQIVPLNAVIVVKNNSHLQKAHNLLGRDLYFPPRSTAVSYLAKYHLKHSGIDLENDLHIIHESTHVTCLQKVLIGLADACVTAKPVIQFIEEKLGVKLRTIAESVNVPHALFAVKSSMDPKLKADLLQEILSWQLNNQNKELLTNARLESFKPINDSDYDIVRKIKKEMDSF